ncbi:MAG: hypothetical protein QOJ42_3056, partial [Acidobacteriaceae bacterium]|nr:hypothetical protein [Acidobacteriaceae bacterium]
LVTAGYHITELKTVTYNTMDCGGVSDKWEERTGVNASAMALLCFVSAVRAGLTEH